MTDVIKPILELIQQYGAWAFVLALAAVVFLMFSRTWTKQRDAQTTADLAKTEILANANEAQEIINRRVVKLEEQTIDQAKSIQQLQAELATTKESLAKARRHIRYLKRQLDALEKEKGALATERDQLRADLNSAKQRIQDLEREVFKLQAKLQAEKNVQEAVVTPILDLLQRAIPPHTGDTGRLDPSKVPASDPAALHVGDVVKLEGAPPDNKKAEE